MKTDSYRNDDEVGPSRLLVYLAIERLHDLVCGLDLDSEDLTQAARDRTRLAREQDRAHDREQ